MRMAHNAAMKMRHLWEGCALPNPPLREGDGEIRFPRMFTSVTTLSYDYDTRLTRVV